MRRTAGSAAVTLLLLLASVATAQETGSVVGVLFDVETAAPLSGVKIFVDGEEAGTTNENGGFDLELPPGEHVLELQRDGARWPAVDPVVVFAGGSVELLMDAGPTSEPLAVVVEGAAVEAEAAAQETELPTSTVRGLVIHEETGDPVEGVRIYVKGTSVNVKTDAEGRFELVVAVGSHDLSAVHPEFSTMTKNGVRVVEGRVTTVELSAVPVGMQLDDFVVTAPRIEGGTAALIDERKEAGNVSDVIGAEQMAKSGDSDAAGALKRVPGVTLVGGKYIYVRGLGERYSCTLLNGATLPSPEPERRVIPLDLFPTGILDSVIVQKTFSPDMPAEFGGGAVLLRTRKYPEEFTLDIKVSTGVTTGTTFTEGLKAVGGPTDWLGVDGGWRAMPDDLREASKENYLLEGDMLNPGYSAEELETYGESLRNNWRTYRETIPPDFGLTVTVGNSFRLGRAKLGFLSSAIYANEWDREEAEIKILSTGSEEEGATVFHNYKWDETTNQIRTAGILTLGLELTEDHVIKSTTLLNRITDDTARYYWGYNRDLGNDIRVWRIRWVERMLFTQQFSGKHVIQPLHDLTVDWRYTYSRANRDEPDRKDVAYNREGETDLWLISDRPEGNSRVFSELSNQSHDLGLDLTLPFEQWTDEEATVKVGGNVVLKEREVDTRRYRYKFRPTQQEIASLPPWELFTDDYIGMTDEYGVHNKFEETTRPTDNYRAEQEIFSAYAMTDFPLGGGVSLMGGVRMEKSRQFVRTYDLFDEDEEPVDATLETTDYLPAAVLSWEMVEGMIVRGGFGQTVSRPDFREMSPSSFTDIIGGRDVEGNPDLTRTLIHSVDLRWEWYFLPGESVSFGGFFKHFTDPIERIIVLRAQHAETYTNAEAARNFGLELDFRKSFGWLADSLEDLYLSGNATWVYSRIDLDEDEGIQTNSERPLQGQSPYIFNALLGYDNIDTGTNIALLYNVFGRRISTVGARGGEGTEGLPDEYEEPFHQLDLVFGQELPHGFKLGFKAQNILDLPAEHTQGGVVTETRKKGRAFKLSLSWSY